ncbi:MAG: hypothetical protein H0V79_12785 [Actinobacteria bacterium]|nr:hypothetical protein [Actinomycetota bacterium]
MTLRVRPIEQDATLPDGRRVVVRVGVPEDPYIPKRELDTVALELVEDGQISATVNTVLGPEHESEARRLALDVAARLESGELEPTAGALEPLADSIP